MSFKKLLHQLNRRDTHILPRLSQFTKVLSAIVLVSFAILTTRNIIAQNTNPGAEYIKNKQEAIKKGNNQEAWLNEAMGSNVISSMQALTGEIPNDVLEGKTSFFIPSGAIGMTNNLVAFLYNQPASGIEYIAQLKDNLLGRPAYAQGIGFTKLQAILPLWKLFRNVVYVLSAVIFVVIGIMVMLRVKISPQAVVTIQSSIPQIITTLILVTFSYAIAGLLIDLNYFFQAVVLAILFQNSATGSLTQGLFSHGSYNPDFFTLSQADLGTAIALAFKATPFLTLMLLGTLPGLIIGMLMAATPLSAAGLGIGLIGAAIGPVLVALIISILILVWITKFFFGLIKCYINIIFKIILAPLEIGLGAIPNSKMGFSTWLTDIVANLAVFPISIIFLVLANIIIDATAYKGLWYPTLLDAANVLTPVKIVANASGGLVTVGIGLSALMILSKLPELIPQAIFQLKPSAWGAAVGQSFKETKDSGAIRFGRQAGLEYGADVIDSRYQAAVNGPAGPTRAQRFSNALVNAARTTGLLRDRH